jgi:GT2 family glycosyltransferase
MKPLVWIIVLNWNGKKLLRDCLGSLSSLDYSNYKVLFVDNASSDGSVEFVKENYPFALTIVNDKNLGYAAGNNVGIRFALSKGADYIVLLNNDTRVEPDFLTKLIVRGEQKRDAGVLGGKILMFQNPVIVNSTGVNLNLFAYGWDRDFGEENAMAGSADGAVLAVTGCMMAVKKEVFEAAGLLDPAYFAYFEDVDFCLRVWQYTDFKVEYVSDSVIYHKFSASSSADPLFKLRLMIRNQYRIFLSHFPFREILKLFPRFTMHRWTIMLIFLRRYGPELFFMEALVLLMSWLKLPAIALGRLLRPGRRADMSYFHRMVTQETCQPVFKGYCPGYERIVFDKAALGQYRVRSRIVMGVTDELLGLGWSQLRNDFPGVRRISDSATCYLMNCREASYLQIHGLWDTPAYTPNICVSIEGSSVLETEPVIGWSTYQIPLRSRFAEGPVEVKIRICRQGFSRTDDAGFAINEIGLYSLGSPELRWLEE